MSNTADWRCRPTVRSPPRLCVQAVGSGLVGRRLWSVTRAH